MSINLILARDANNGIGQNNGLPWPHNKQDMKWFKDNTLDNVVLMGRKTWESIGSKPLPNRYNYIISSRDYGTHVAGYQKSFGEAIENLTAEYPYNDIWIIGGASIYEQAIDVADNLYLTTFTNTYECDTKISQELVDSFPDLVYNKVYDDVKFEIWSKE